MSEACGLSGLYSTAHRRRRRLTTDFLVLGIGYPRDWQPASKMNGLCSTVHRIVSPGIFLCLGRGTQGTGSQPPRRMKPVASLVSAPLSTKNVVASTRIVWCTNKMSEACGLSGLCPTVHRRLRCLTKNFLEIGAGRLRHWQPASKMSEA